MPLYYFDFMEGDLCGRDNFGTKLPNVETAAKEAVSALANISKDVRARYQDRVLALNVRRQDGKIVLHVSLTLAVKWPPDDQVEHSEAESIQPTIPSMRENAAATLTSEH
jgi:hypothetical protein